MRLLRILTNKAKLAALEARVEALQAELEDERATIVTVVSADPRLESSVINFLSAENEALKKQLAEPNDPHP